MQFETIPRGRFIALNACIWKEERPQINQSSTLRKQEKSKTNPELTEGSEEQKSVKLKRS
jgi:hypothetical protein